MQTAVIVLFLAAVYFLWRDFQHDRQAAWLATKLRDFELEVHRATGVGATDIANLQARVRELENLLGMDEDSKQRYQDYLDAPDAIR